MPQMQPMNWLIQFTYFNACLFLIILKTYYSMKK